MRASAVVYQLGPNLGSLRSTYLGDLHAVDRTNPLVSIPLDAINKTTAAAAATARDQHRSYEAAFAPVASGGYFWLVFHSCRTYGNRLVDVAYDDDAFPLGEGSGTKQLSVAALDVATATSVSTDPSHPPFWLLGQDSTTRNMRAYWALDPCHADGDTCSTGTDCCDATGDAGAAVCGRTTRGLQSAW